MALAREAAMHAVNRVFQDLQQDLAGEQPMEIPTEDSNASLQKRIYLLHFCDYWFSET